MPLATRLTPIATGPLGAIQTMAILARAITAPDPRVARAVAALRQGQQADQLTDAELARAIFDAVRGAMRYADDAGVWREAGDPASRDVIQWPGALLALIAAGDGPVAGDCDDYVSLLGGLYHALGWPVTLVWVSVVQPDGGPDVDHIFLRVRIAGHWWAADAIPDAAGVFGWEPTKEVPGVASRVEWVV